MINLCNWSYNPFRFHTLIFHSKSVKLHTHDVTLMSCHHIVYSVVSFTQSHLLNESLEEHAYVFCRIKTIVHYFELSIWNKLYFSQGLDHNHVYADLLLISGWCQWAPATVRSIPHVSPSRPYHQDQVLPSGTSATTGSHTGMETHTA